MKKTTFFGAAVAVLLLSATAVAFAAGGLSPHALMAAWHLSPSDLATAVMLANAPVARPEIKELVQSIMRGFEEFKTTNDARLKAVEKSQSDGDFQAKLAKIQTDLTGLLDLKKEVERVEAKMNRTGLGSGKEIDPSKAEYKTAFFERFVRKGDDTGMKDLQQKAMSIGTAADGGYAVPEEIDREIEKLARDVSPMRQVSRVIRVGTSDYKKLVNKNGIASGWVGETAARPATNTSQLAEVIPPMGELYANPQVTQQALDDIFYDVEADVQEQLVEEFSVAEGSAFTTGDGTNKPKGFLAYTAVATGDSARAFGSLEYVPTGVAGDFAASNKADIFFDTMAKMKRAYRAGSLWMMPKTVLFEVLKIKDSSGQYLWQPSLQDSGLGIKLLGYMVEENEDMPVKAASSLSIAFGNFKRGYFIVDRMGMRMLRDPYSNKPYVGFYTTKRVGGGVVNSEAIKLIKFAVS